MDIRFLTADDLDHLPPGKDRVLVVLTTRREIEECNLGSAIERLLELSDNPQHARDFCGAVAWVVDGFNDDHRELYQIPEVRRYFQGIHASWPHWGYFGSDELGELSQFLTYLCSVEVIQGPGNLVGAALAPYEVHHHLQVWRNAIRHLGTYHDLPAQAADRLARINQLAAQFPL